eukprot:scaffold10045_cov114-Isochrysis_galbana.AAC.2
MQRLSKAAVVFDAKAIKKGAISLKQQACHVRPQLLGLFMGCPLPFLLFVVNRGIADDGGFGCPGGRQSLACAHTANKHRSSCPRGLRNPARRPAARARLPGLLAGVHGAPQCGAAPVRGAGRLLARADTRRLRGGHRASPRASLRARRAQAHALPRLTTRPPFWGGSVGWEVAAGGRVPTPDSRGAAARGKGWSHSSPPLLPRPGRLARRRAALQLTQGHRWRILSLCQRVHVLGNLSAGCAASAAQAKTKLPGAEKKNPGRGTPPPAGDLGLELARGRDAYLALFSSIARLNSSPILEVAGLRAGALACEYE